METLWPRGRIDEAIAQYQKALKIRPDYALAHNNLGNLLANRGQFEAAIDEYQKALKTRPGDIKAHYNLALVLADHGRPVEAIEHFQTALGLATAANNSAWLNSIGPNSDAVGRSLRTKGISLYNRS